MTTTTGGPAHVARSRTTPPSQTIDRATLILTCFTTEQPHQTLAQLTAKLHLNQSTVYRYVATLRAAGLLARDERRGGYRLGLRVVELAYVALNQLDVRKEAIPEMDRLRDEVQLLVNLAVLDQGDVIHLAHSVPVGWPVWATTPGRRAVANCTALGKALLAYQPWEEVRRGIEQRGWRPYTARSIQSFDDLEADLAETRRRGYAIDEEERDLGVVCHAAPIRDHAGRVIAAMSVTARGEKLTPLDREHIAARVVDTAKRISFRLGNSDGYAYL